ncbi:nuclease-related domain-containing protein [Microbacterium capsulatum]|uniref:Nuclease-related domain-containing protein n=1 Tax=Microbacterium capsulatum TaxID=3041921 RepID=A0ABU0XG08_9MICO|nr:nuclease-related domain-containing protein [Microbacterium sp. ASV81]MDQ4214048.1 nuclease-related domain-containing protein [Microbacterium sp. ASV81]
MNRYRSLQETFGAQGRVGQLGERYFSRGIKKSGLDKFQVFYSLSIPDVPNRPHLGGDIDCVLVNGNRVVLIDVKRWAGSRFWSFPLLGEVRPMKGLGWYRPNGDWKLSRNMEAAMERIRFKLPGADVSAIVVFVPTQDGDLNSVPGSVDLLIWPGAIRSFISGHAFAELYDRLGREVVEPAAHILQTLARLERRG